MTIDKPLTQEEHTRNVTYLKRALSEEFGITRDFIRAEVKQIVERTVQSQIRALLEEKALQASIRSAVDSFLRSGGKGPSDLHSTIIRATSEAVTRHMEVHLSRNPLFVEKLGA